MAQRSGGLSGFRWLCGRCGLLPALAAAALLVMVVSAVPAGAAPPSGEGWQSLQAESLVIHYRDHDAGLAQAISDIGPSNVDYISTATGTPIPEHIDVILAGDFATFSRLQPSPPPSWAVGTAWSGRNEIYLRTGLPHTGPDPIQKTFTHELCHIMVGSVFENGRPPRWLQEGVAMLFAGEMRPSDQAVLVRAAASDSLLPMSEITRKWPMGSRQAHLAYLQSVDFVAYMFRQGEGVLSEMIQELAAGRDLQASVASATGRSLAELEEDWRKRMTIWHALIPLLGGQNAFWGFASVLFLVAAWKRRGQKRAKLAALEEQERLAANSDDGLSGL